MRYSGTNEEEQEKKEKKKEDERANETEGAKGSLLPVVGMIIFSERHLPLESWRVFE